MPFLFGAIITNNKFSYKNFLLLLNIAKDLPARFHRWYGDQYSLKLAIEKNKLILKKKSLTNLFKFLQMKKILIILRKI